MPSPAAEHLRQLRAVQNGPLDELHSGVQMRRCSNIENDRRVTWVSSLGRRACPRFPDPLVSSTFMVFFPITPLQAFASQPHLRSMKPPTT